MRIRVKILLDNHFAVDKKWVKRNLLFVLFKIAIIIVENYVENKENFFVAP